MTILGYRQTLYTMPRTTIWKPVMQYVVLILSWCIAFILIVIVFRLTVAVSRAILSESHPVINTFTVDSEDKPILSEQFLHRTRRLGDSSRSSTRLPEFLNATNQDVYLAIDTAERTASALQRTVESAIADDLELKVGGVDVASLVRSVATLVARPTSTIDGAFVTHSDSISLELTLREHGNIWRSWIISRDLSTSDLGDQQKQQQYEDMLDEAAIRLAVHLRNEKGSETVNDLDEAALVNLHDGRQHLDRYLQTDNQDELTQAQDSFYSLVQKRPDYVDGLLMLGFSLSENRQESEAIRVYEQARDIFAERKDQDDEAQKRLLDTRFLIATAHLRNYNWEEGCTAIHQLRDLAAELTQRIQQLEATSGRSGTTSARTKQINSERHYLYHLLARTYVETAHCYGHLIAYLRHTELTTAVDKLDTALPGESLPAEMGEWESKRWLAARFLEQNRSFCGQAAAVKPIHRNEWKADLRARISEVEGYALYRHAHWLATGENESYRTACNAALRSLQQAELRNRRKYSLLQNIAMVLVDRRFDAGGYQLRSAGGYVERSTELKPNDYYGHQLTATVFLRQALRATSAPEITDHLDKGMDEIGKALELNPHSYTSQVTDLYLRTIKATVSAGESAERERLDDLTVVINGHPRFSTDFRLRWLDILCRCEALRREANEEEFGTSLDTLKTAVRDIVGDTQPFFDADWSAAEIHRAASRLSSDLDGVTFADRESLEPAHDAAIPIP